MHFKDSLGNFVQFPLFDLKIVYFWRNFVTLFWSRAVADLTFYDMISATLTKNTADKQKLVSLIYVNLQNLSVGLDDYKILAIKVRFWFTSRRDDTLQMILELCLRVECQSTATWPA